MTNTAKINPEETLIYKELESKLKASDPVLWVEVFHNIHQVIKDTNPDLIFKDTADLLDCFIFNETEQGHDYWFDIYSEITKNDF